MQQDYYSSTTDEVNLAKPVVPRITHKIYKCFLRVKHVRFHVLGVEVLVNVQKSSHVVSILVVVHYNSAFSTYWYLAVLTEQ